MLTLSARLADLGAEMIASGSALEFGRSRLEPFESAQLEMSCRESRLGTDIWIGEGPDPCGSDGRPAASVEDYRNHAISEGVHIHLPPGSGGDASIVITRTSAGGTPLYLAAKDGAIHASWRFEHAVEKAGRRVPNKEACRLYLAHGDAQVRDQVIEGVSMLWPGESAAFGADGLRFRQAEVEVVLPNALTDSARATDEFLYLIAEALRPGLAKARAPVVELSGGYDSSCVAIAACSAAEKMNSYGLIHEGAMGAQQRRRRQELIDLLGPNDFEFPSSRHPPLASLEVPEATITILDDNHRISCASALDAHPVQGLDLVITGVGGDELTKENSFHRREWEVRGATSASAIVTAAARSDMFMRRGLWPKNPLLAGSVVDFCRALPQKMRAGRMLNILTLARSGLSDGFLFPRFAEHYGVSMQYEAACYDYDAALSQSIVADYGIANIAPLLQRARDASYGGFSYMLIFELFTLLKLEKVLRRYCG
jgi:hypothetical protein